jgi:lipopolysaccharide export LptBFGC system permease protein LptF
MLLVFGIVSFLVYENLTPQKKNYLNNKVNNSLEKVSTFFSKKEKVEYLLKDESCKKIILIKNSKSSEHYNECMSSLHYQVTNENDNIIEGTLKIEDNEGNSQKGYFKAELGSVLDEIVVKKICIGTSSNNLFIGNNNPLLELSAIETSKQLGWELPKVYKKCPL